ncbi:helix-turn-helix domain-containing protein [Amycolatopsis anabasis]|uniref:helix-turn-helix domain-containing protein n=1 Tax=Amycolatopsis anabasis TaxID=1840409 RepID=UPI00131EA52D|nr:helix-turn-helix domain-containing protein [Amycolatopsis anabasis]
METAGATLRQLLITLGEPLVELLAAPGGLDVEVGDVVILDPDDEPGAEPGDLVLIVGARGRSALRLVRAVARRGATVAAVKLEQAEDLEGLRAAAADSGIAVLTVRPEVRWDQLATLAIDAVADAREMTGAEPGEATDLFSLAQTIAALTDGIVSIEDTASRVLAYSRSDDEVDELRRLSILGRQGPEDYLALLRSWGVFERLNAGDEVVRIDEHAELGIRRRLAVGIRAGAQWLGTVWVQEGRNPLSEQAESAVLGAARVAALHLVRRRTGPAAGLQENLLAGLLDNRIDAQVLAGSIGADLGKPAVVTAFGLSDSGPSVDADRPTLELRGAAMNDLISVHAAAYRRSALVTTSGSRVYLLLPDLPGRSADQVAVGLAREIVAAAGKRLRLTVRAAAGSVVPSLRDIAESKTEADRVLDVMAREGRTGVATIADVRSEVLVGETLALLERQPRLRDPRVNALVAHDGEHGSELVPSLIAYLDRLGDVRAAARSLGVHPNTLRYRLKRAAALSGLDLTDPRQTLFAHLQLLLTTRTGS